MLLLTEMARTRLRWFENEASDEQMILHEFVELVMAGLEEPNEAANIMYALAEIAVQARGVCVIIIS